MKTEVLKQIEGICHNHQIVGVWFFGSRAKEVADYVLGRNATLGTSLSDIDVGILLRKDLSYTVKTLVRITAQLEDIFDVGRIDLVTLNDASAFVAAEIVQGLQVVDLDGKATAEFELYALRRAADLIRYRQLRTEAVIKDGAI